MKQNTLQGNSKVYNSQADIYEEFVDAEDYSKKILKFLKPKIENKIVLDVGCVNGKFASEMAHLSSKYIGIDISEAQINKAKVKTAENKNVKLICCSATNLPLPSESVDIVISLWAVSVIRGRRNKRKVLKEMERVLKKDGEIYLVENDFSGDFEIMRGHPIRTKKYHKWLEKNGFKSKKMVTYFNFKSFEDAKRIFHAIWKGRVSNKVKNKVINHNIVLFSKKKSFK